MVKEEEYLLTNQEILGGIKSALSRGETLKQAMMSFYKAGYKKEEIEDAARAYLYLQRGVPEENILSEKEKALKENIEKANEKEMKIKKEIEDKKKIEEKRKIEEERMKKEKKLYSSGETKVPLVPGEKMIEKEPEKKPVIPFGMEKNFEEKKVIQKVSNYGGQKMVNPEKGKTMTIVLIITLIILLGVLGLVFLFRSELINFINGLFG